MKPCKPMVPLGDRGQTYQVVQVQHDGTEMVWGWTNEADGGRLASAAKLHPETASVRVIDRARPEGVGMDQKPSVGRIVHYQSYGSPGGEYKSEPRAAIITGVVNDTTVHLCVLNPEGIFLNKSCYFDGSESPKGGTWHWPPRV